MAEGGDERSHVEAVNEQAVVGKWNLLRSELNQLYAKISEMELELNEHTLVINAIKPLDAKRKCFRMIGGVLVERTVEEVIPAVQNNKDGLQEVIGKLAEALEKKRKELVEFETRYKIKIRRGDASDSNSSDAAAPKEGSAQGVLVGPAAS